MVLNRRRVRSLSPPDLLEVEHTAGSRDTDQLETHVVVCNTVKSALPTMVYGRVIDLENSTRHDQTSVKRPDLELVQERRKQCGARYK
jgi:hypothetical protein